MATVAVQDEVAVRAATASARLPRGPARGTLVRAQESTGPSVFQPSSETLLDDATSQALTARSQDTQRTHSSPSKDQAAWAAATQNHLKAVRALRCQLQDASGWCEAHFEEPRKEAAKSAPPLRHSVNGCLAAEDRLKKQRADERALGAALGDRTESTERIIFQVLQAAGALQRAGGTLLSALGVTEKRLELRRRRPESEFVHDTLDEALESERAILLDWRQQLAVQASAGQEALAPVFEARVEMQHRRLTLHQDRSGQAWMFLEHVKQLEDVAIQYCEKTQQALVNANAHAGRARQRTVATLRKRLGQTQELRRQLEAEIKEAQTAITEAEKNMDRMQRRLNDFLQAPEREHDDRIPFLRRSSMDMGHTTTSTGGASPSRANSVWQSKLARLRSKVKASSYTGTSGRQLSVVFSRFDRDGSGELSEDEIRTALRRTLKISTDVISDGEIAVLFNMIDVDRSGSVSIPEIVLFLASDTDAEALQEQITNTSTLLEGLRSGMGKLVEDLRMKTATWKIDEACLRVTPIQGLDLDCGVISTKPADPRGRRGKQLKPEVLETLRSRIKSAAYTGVQGRQMDVVFARMDKDGSGQLDDDEVRQAFRRILKIPPSVCSDDDFASFCGMLDVDNTGSVSMAALLDFMSGGGRVGDTAAQTPPPNSSKERPGSRATSLPAASARKPPPPPNLKQPVKLLPERLEIIRSRLKAASYTGTSGRDLETLFARFDKDGSGFLDFDETRLAFRRVLRLPPKVVSDAEVLALCKLFDHDGDGHVSVHELSEFIGAEPTVSRRTNRPVESEVM